MAEEQNGTIRSARFGLRLKLTVGLVLMIGVMFSGASLFNYYSKRQKLEAAATTTRNTVLRLVLFALTDQLANADIHDGRIKNFLTNYLNNALIADKSNRDIAFVLVTDNAGKVIGGRAHPTRTIFKGNKRFKSEKKALSEIARLDGKLGSAMFVSRVAISTSSGKAGKLYVGTYMTRLRRELRQDLYVSAGVTLGTLLLLFIYSALALGRMVTRPIGKVMHAMRAVHEGDLREEVDLKANDEIGVLADTYNFMVHGLREREQLKDAFSRYVSTQVYDKLQLGQINLEGEERNATVLFSDIRAFTALSERLQPHEVVALLNEYFDVMVEIVFKYDGFLNKFIGDALMAVYNVPVDQEQPELRAVRTALEMSAALQKLNQDRAARGQFAIKIGIGVNTGPVTAGNIGHVRRLEYTVIGDTVNLAQRIESQTKVTGMPILISQTTYEAVQQLVVAQPLPPVKVKGKQEPVALYAVTGLKGDQPASSPSTPMAVPGAPAAQPAPARQATPAQAPPAQAAPPHAAPPHAAPPHAAPAQAPPAQAAPPQAAPPRAAPPQATPPQATPPQAAPPQAPPAQPAPPQAAPPQAPQAPPIAVPPGPGTPPDRGGQPPTA